MKFYKKMRSIASIALLMLTIWLFSRYLQTHPDLISQLRQVAPFSLFLLLALYGCMTGVLMLIMYYSLLISGTKITIKENALLSIYSSIVNFFGPLQSGPGFRAIYLKRRFRVNYKDFIRFSLLYYGFFAFFSALFLFGPSLPFWLAALILFGVIAVCAIVLRNQRISLGSLPSQHVIKLGLATLLQVLLVALIYFIELRTVDSHTSFRQAIIYTGAGNFALFVSLTPGAIGFRESFLLLTNRLHHIPNDTVIAASVIDRGIYLVFLGILFGLALSLHAKDKLGVKKSPPTN